MIYINAGAGEGLKMSGTMPELSAECVMIMRTIYKQNLELFPEPEIAAGLLANMLVRAMREEENTIVENDTGTHFVIEKE